MEIRKESMQTSDIPPQNPLFDSSALPEFRFLKRLLAGNPFFLLSPLVLLYGIYRLSVDPKFLPTETLQLIFNFGSLQVYEFVIAGLVVFLGIRRIRYDSVFLFWVETGLAAVPFILISQSLFLGGSLVAVFLSTAVVAAATRFHSSGRRLFPRTNLSGLNAAGVCLLTVNLAMPLVFKHVQKESNALWEAENLTLVSHWIWCAALPLVVLIFGSFFARPIPHLHGRWTRTFVGGIWLLGTLAHFRSLAYIYSFSFEGRLLIPILWALSLAANFAPLPRSLAMAQRFLPLAMGGFVLLAFPGPLAAIYFAIGCAVQLAAWVGGDDKVLFRCAIANGIVGVMAVWFSFAGISNAEIVLRIILIAFVVFSVLFRIIPAFGIVLAGIVFFFQASAGGPSPFFVLAAVQTAFGVLALHSLFWDHPRAARARLCVAVTWLIFAFWFVADARNASELRPLLFCGLAGIGLLGWLRYWTGSWKSVSLAVASGIVTLFGSLSFVGDASEHFTSGSLALFFAFLLLIPGTILALRRVPPASGFSG
jgi:hypothetical protein